MQTTVTHKGQVTIPHEVWPHLDVAGLSSVARPEGRIKLGSLLAHMGQQAGGFDLEIEREASPTEPVRFE
jgi:hypothetical protein